MGGRGWSRSACVVACSPMSKYLSGSGLSSRIEVLKAVVFCKSSGKLNVAAAESSPSQLPCRLQNFPLLRDLLATASSFANIYDLHGY